MRNRAYVKQRQQQQLDSASKYWEDTFESFKRGSSELKEIIYAMEWFINSFKENWMKNIRQADPIFITKLDSVFNAAIKSRRRTLNRNGWSRSFRYGGGRWWFLIISSSYFVVVFLQSVGLWLVASLCFCWSVFFINMLYNALRA